MYFVGRNNLNTKISEEVITVVRCTVSIKCLFYGCQCSFTKATTSFC